MDVENPPMELPIPALLRFLGPEEAYLSNCNDGPRFLINLDDHLSYPPGRINHDFQASLVIQISGWSHHSE